MLIFFLIHLSHASDDSKFISYISSQSKSLPLDYSHRLSVFKSNFDLIQSSNFPDFFLSLGPNADKSPEDFEVLPEVPAFPPLSFSGPAPASVDWVEEDKVSVLKTLSNCKASWAFAAIDTIESAISIGKNISAIELSVQQIVSCSNSYGNSGCSSGSLISSYSYALNSFLCSKMQYPFIDKATVCKKMFFCQNRINGFAPVQALNEWQLKLAVAQQPVAVVLNVTSVLLNYGGGIITKSGCGTSVYQSYFVIVGFGSLAGMDYWVIRSYWGSGWGIGGYALVERNDLNTNDSGACGIAFGPYVPIFNP